MNTTRILPLEEAVKRPSPSTVHCSTIDVADSAAGHGGCVDEIYKYVTVIQNRKTHDTAQQGLLVFMRIYKTDLYATQRVGWIVRS